MTSPQSQHESATDAALPARSQWQVCLAAVARTSIKALVDDLSTQYTVRSLKPANAGLGMLQLQDSVRHDGFHVGEFTVSTALVELTSEAGETLQGGAVIMRDDEWLAAALAIFDAVLSTRGSGWQRVEALVLEGQRRLADVERDRQLMLAKTAVEFSALDQDV